jgi:hypothetical protein
LAVVALSAATLSTVNGPTHPAHGNDRALLVPSSIDLRACQSRCDPCNNEMGHELVEDSGGPLAGAPHKCESLDPCDDKTVCDPEAPEPTPDALAANEAEAIRVAVVEQQYRVLERYVVAMPDRVTLNVGRSAIQLLDCAGQVIAHYPIPNSAARSITTALNDN